MKKLLSSIIILLALCITCPQVYSGGTTTQTVQLNKNFSITMVTVGLTIKNENNL